MRLLRSSLVVLAVLLTALLLPVSAEIVYTSVNVSIPTDGQYNLDLNRDGIPDFTLRSHLLQDYCQLGDGYVWNLSITPASGNAVVAANGNDASALLQEAPVDADQPFLFGRARLAELDWGTCGQGQYGQWLNLPHRYLGLEFRLRGGSTVYYGWAEVSEVAFVDHHGHLQTFAMLQAFAYETVPGRAILAGQTSDSD